MIQPRARIAGLETRIANHTFRATGSTAYLKNKGTLEAVQHIANHESLRTTNLYDRRQDEISLDEVEKISIYKISAAEASGRDVKQTVAHTLGGILLIGLVVWTLAGTVVGWTQSINNKNAKVVIATIIIGLFLYCLYMSINHPGWDAGVPDSDFRGAEGLEEE